MEHGSPDLQRSSLAKTEQVPRHRQAAVPAVAVALALVLAFAASQSQAGNGADNGATKTPPGQSPPASTSLPTISGSPVVGQTLTANVGSWSGSAAWMVYSFQWVRCDSFGNLCASLAGASASAYVVVANDVGYTLRVTVTATNKYGSSAATSDPSAVVTAPATVSAPASTSLPTITGTTTVGQTLTASTGTWSGSPTSYAYQWRRCDSSGGFCTNVTGATSASYALTSSDAGSTMRVTVTATNSGGSTAATSAQTAAVSTTVTVSAPASTSLPTITGTTTVGQTLTASTGTWSGSPTSYAYQWKRCDSAGASCANISGATSASYGLTSSDTTYTMRVMVTATNTTGSTSATSTQTSAVATSTTTSTSAYPSSFFSGPAGTNILLPPNAGYPAKGVWLGETGNGLTQVQSREQYLGRKFNIYSYYAQNRCDPYPSILSSVVASGHIPMISWFPTPAYADQIIAGAADSCIKSFGNAIASQSGRVLVRLYWEFNGGWFNFSKNSDGTRATATQEKQMWQHTVDVLRTTNALSKASMVWCPHEGYYNNGDAWNNPTPYPGDSYVDWTCSDGFNHNDTSWCGFHSGWCTFADTFTHGRTAPTYTPRGVEFDFRGRKPYIVGETGSLEDPNTPGRKGQWMLDMGKYAKTYMPGLYALIYFDQSTTTGAWSLDTSTSSIDGFKSIATDSYFNIASS